MSQDLFGEDHLEDPDDPIEFSGVSGSASSASSQHDTQSQPASQPTQPTQPIVYPCSAPGCKKVLKTHRGIIRHQAAHKINGIFILFCIMV